MAEGLIHTPVAKDSAFAKAAAAAAAYADVLLQSATVAALLQLASVNASSRLLQQQRHTLMCSAAPA